MTSLAKITRRATLGVMAAACATFLSACQPLATSGGSGPVTGQMIDPKQPVPVALLVPGGTGSADVDWLARSLTNAAKLAAADAKGATIDLRVYNTSGDAAQAAATAQKAVAEGAKIILGPLHGDAANAAGLAVAPQNVNVIAFSNNPAIAGGNVFVIGNTFQNTANRLVKYAGGQGKRRIMIVAEDDPAGQIGAAAIQTAIARNGAQVAGQANHAVSMEGINRIVPSVAAAAKSGNVDAIFMTANQGAVLPYLTEALSKAGVSSATTQMMGLTRWDQPAARLQLPGVQEGWFAVPDTTLRAQFDQRYRAAYGEAPHELGSLAYDGVAAIASLVRAGKANALTSRGLTQGSGFAGVNGVFRFRPDGTNERGLAIATIRNKQLVILDPAPRSFGGFGF